jgi:hypothetical protein
MLLLLAIVVLPLLLGVFTYQIITTPVTAVDAPTLLKSGAPPPDEAPASRREASGGLGSGVLAVLAIGGLAAGIIGGWMLHRPARGATACSPHAIQICSQGSVVLTGSQLAGAAIGVTGILVVAIAAVLATR